MFYCDWLDFNVINGFGCYVVLGWLFYLLGLCGLSLILDIVCLLLLVVVYLVMCSF